MRPVLLSERDREVLRGFASRIDPADAGAHNNLGVLYYHKGMTEEAVAAFTRALALDPRMAIAERNLRVAYCDTGYFERTVAALRAKLAANPGDRAARRALADAFLLAGQPSLAVPELQALVAAAPDDTDATTRLARALHRAGDLESAMQWLRRALERRPGDPDILFPLAEVAYHRGLNEEAEATLRALLTQAPDHADGLYLLGFVLGDRGCHDEAREVTRRAMQLNPSLGRAQTNLSLERPDRAAAIIDDPGEPALHEGGTLVHYNLGLAFRQKGYYAEALREYRLALERGEDRALVTQAMAEVHLLRREGTAAVQLYDGLVRESPQSPKLWNERGVALHQSGRTDEALVSYERAIAADPQYALALNNLGVARFHSGRADLAIDAFSRALQVEPAFVKARLNLALLLFRRKELPLCLEAYRQVLNLEPGHPVAWNGVGLVLTEMRRFEDARNAFGRAIDGRADYAEAHYNLSFALSNLGDFEGALRATRRALELDPYYVPQKFELAIDLEYENPRVAVPPDLDGERRTDDTVTDFAFDVTAIEALFDALAPATTPVARGLEGAPAFATARQRLAAGEYDRAIDEARRAIELGAPHGDGLVLIGEAYYQRGAYGEALERFRQARGEDPASTPALAGEVRALVALGRERDAEAAAEELVARCPDDVDTLLLVARVRATTGDTERALALLAEARRLAPMRADVPKQIGDVARMVGDDAAAIEAWRHAIALDRDYAAARVDLAALYITHGATAEAEQELVAALASVPTYTEAALALAALRRTLGRADETLDLLVNVLERDPWQLDALASLGESLFQCGRRDDARVAFARVRRFEPEHVGALYFEGVLFAEERRYAEALARWEQVVALEPAGEYARRARRDGRTALDLQRIFAARERRSIERRLERRGAA